MRGKGSAAGKICFILRDFRGRVLVSGRFCAGMLVFFLVNRACFGEMPEGLAAMGYGVDFLRYWGVYMCSMVPMVLFYAALAFQVCAFPEREGSGNAVQRLGRRWWFAGQVLHCVLVFLVQYLVLVLSVLSALYPCLGYGGRWSSFMTAACSDIVVVIRTGLNNTMDFDAALMSWGSPLYVAGVSFLLNLLCSTAAGTVAVLLNTMRQRGAGTLFFMLFIASRYLTDFVSAEAGERLGEGFLLDAVDTVCHALSPAVQNTLSGIGMARHGITGGLPPAGRLAWALGYLVLLAAGSWAWGTWKIRDTDLS